LVSADGGVTLPEERLTRVSTVGSGRSGLKKKVYFNQLPVEVPFHSSALRHAFDELYEHVNKKVVVPSSSENGKNIFADVCDTSSSSVYSPKLHWIPNITETRFNDKSSFSSSLLETLSENVNVGEQTHFGKVVPKNLNQIIQNLQQPIEEQNQRDLVCSALTSQLCNVVCWSQTMDTIAENLVMSGDNEEESSSSTSSVVIEFAPSTSVLNEMMKKAHPDVVQKENYFLLPRDMDKCVKSFLR